MLRRCRAYWTEKKKRRKNKKQKNTEGLREGHSNNIKATV